MISKDKLLTNFGTLTKFEKIIYLLFIRPFIQREDCIFFDGSFFLPGQMYKEEREALYNIVREAKPDYCFEIGTYTGGGSTFFISKALKDNGSGKLLTIENNEFLYNKAKNRYNRFIRSQYSFIEFIFSSSPDVFKKYLEKNKSNFFFLDGAENGQQTLEQYEFFRQYFKKGSILALHDWNTEKTAHVKPMILSDGNWKKIIELNRPESIGFAAFRYE